MIFYSKNWSISTIFILGTAFIIINSCGIRKKQDALVVSDEDQIRAKALFDSVSNSHPSHISVMGSIAIRKFRDGSIDTLNLELDQDGNSKVDLAQPKTNKTQNNKELSDEEYEKYVKSIFDSLANNTPTSIKILDSVLIREYRDGVIDTQILKKEERDMSIEYYFELKRKSPQK
ncbi:hypothetical protein ACP6L2_11420 [Sphingobacterium lactis]|uniref:hypothetical protein n=1 Tax=Sphingobacterium lactis TaxID=797291 RepID=UPI003F822DB1